MSSANFNPQGLVGILCSRAEVYFLLGRGQEALADADRAWGMADGVQDLTLRRQLQLECLRTKGKVYFLHGKYPELREAAEQALEVSLALRDRKGEGVSLQQLGTLHYILGEYGEAREYYHRSLAINQEIGNRQGEASCQNNIGNVHNSLGEYGEAWEYYQRSLAINQEIGDRRGEASCLNNIGIVHDILGEYGKAREYYQRSLAINREIGDRRGEVDSLNNIGQVHENLGEYERALDTHQQALKIREEIGDRRGEAESLNNIGNILLELGDYPESERAYQKGEDLTKEIGAVEIGAYILAGLAASYLQQDRLRLAEEKILRIRDLAGAFNSRELQGMAHCLLGRLLVKRGEGGPARAAFRESIEIFKEARNELELGKTCYYFAQELRALGDSSESEWYRVQAKEIFQRLGAKGWLRKMEQPWACASLGS
jgi:tetratricopeptide (TPR) repeat protein